VQAVGGGGQAKVMKGWENVEGKGGEKDSVDKRSQKGVLSALSRKRSRENTVLWKRRRIVVFRKKSFWQKLGDGKRKSRPGGQREETEFSPEKKRKLIKGRKSHTSQDEGEGDRQISITRSMENKVLY